MLTLSRTRSLHVCMPMGRESKYFSLFSVTSPPPVQHHAVHCLRMHVLHTQNGCCIYFKLLLFDVAKKGLFCTGDCSSQKDELHT